MKYFNSIILSVLLVLPQLVSAQQISESEAKDKALSFFNSRSATTDNGVLRAPARGSADADVQLAYKATDGTNNLFYVYNNGNNDGFVIIGGDAVAHEILAYVPQGHFNYDSIPDNVKWWLGEYAKEISVVKKMQPQARPTLAPSRTAQSGNTKSVEDLFTDIPDLITTKWDQWEPYNAAIPAIHHTNGDSIISPTGCVPTAIAQIMNYWHWPTTGVGSYSYTLDYGKLDEWSAGANSGDYDGLLPATFSADFGSTTYDWANMLNEYNDSSSQVPIDAVSTLMYHIGVAGYTLYGPGGSGGGIDRTMEALKQHFGYSDRITLLNRGDYLDDEWEEIIYSELLAGRPVYYESNLHAFIIHGYSANYKMFSVNWGWGGFMDGYWKITGTDYAYFVNDENYNLDFVNHGICIHIEPSNTVHPNNFSNVGDTIVVDGIRYDLIGPLSKTVEVTYAPNNEVLYQGELTIPETIVYNDETYTVTKIGRYGLASGVADIQGILMGGMSELTSLQLPNTIRSIARGGLSECGNIKVLQLPEGVELLGEQCFKSMVSLSSITLPSQLTYIPHYCFWDCKALETVTLPASIRALGYYSFYDCPSLNALVLNAIEVPTFNTEPGYCETFDQDFTGRILAVPQVAIDNYRNDPVFGLWERIIPIDSVSAHFGEIFTIDDIQYKVLLSGDEVSAFGYAGNGKDTLIIPSAIIYEGITYPVKAIGPSAFAQLQNVETIIIEEGVEEIGAFSFQDSWISSVYLPTTLNIIRSYAFNNCQMLKSVYLPNGVTTIELWAFNGCWQMKSFEMPNTVVNIGSGVISGCDNLEYIKLSSSLTELPSNLLWRTTIKSIVLPSEVTNIYNGCFAECDSLNTMVCYASIPPYVEIDNGLPVFPQNINRGKLYVPAEFISAYQSAPGWQDWGTILPIVPVDSIHLDDISIRKNAFDTISIQVFPSNVTEGQIFYSSSNPKVAKIDQYGIITAVEVGETTIKAETMDGKSETCTVTVLPQSFVVMYYLDGELFRTDTIQHGNTIVPLPDPAKEGYTFSGWSEIPATMPANDVEVTGSFSINSYKLVYKVDGAEYKALTLDYGTEIAAEPNPTKDGYTFSGWSEIPATMPANNVEVTGSFSINSYILIYRVDGEVYHKDTLNYAANITALQDLTKEGYTFSGWSEIPATMPANNVEVTGSFTVNMYLLKVLINGEIYYSDSIAYGTRLMDYLDLIIQSGIDLSQWELYDNIENITMPAHDVTVTGNITVDGIIGIESNSRFRVYNLAGKFLGEMTDEDLKLLEPGVYIVNNRKIIVK